MSTLDIIKYTINDSTTDGYVELIKTESRLIITIRTHKKSTDTSNQTLLYKNITKNFAVVSFVNDNLICKLLYKNGDISSIKFDSNSSSAYLQFQKTLTEMMNTKHEIIYYTSGREMYIGEILYKQKGEINEQLPNGSGTMYYDIPNYKIKYRGEFENGVFDGAGIFYNIDNKISIIANNISSGNPTQKAKLNINYSNMTKTFDIVFDDVWNKLKMSGKLSNQLFTLSDNFVDRVAELYWINKEQPVDKHLELVNLINRNNKHLYSMYILFSILIILNMTTILMFMNLCK